MPDTGIQSGYQISFRHGFGERMVTFSKDDLDFERKTTSAEFLVNGLCRPSKVKLNILKLLELDLYELWVAGN